MRQPKNQAFAPMISLQKLSQKTELARLISQASSRLSMDTVLNECLPEAFAGQFKINKLDQNTLVLTCNSAKLMTRFRFIESQVIQSLNSRIAPQRIHSIKIKIRPDTSQTSSRTPKIASPARTLSKKNAQILLEEAEHTEDKKLKEILISLSKHTNQDA